MNLFLKLFPMALQLLPTICAGIEKLHGDAAGSTKKQMAKDALAMAITVGSAVTPVHADAVQAIGAAADSVIDGVIAGYNAAGVFTHKTQAAAITS